MDTNTKRNNLPIKTKIKILNEIKNGGKRNEIAKKYRIGVSMLSKIIKNLKILKIITVL